MSSSTELLFYGALVAVATAIGLATYVLAAAPRTRVTHSGERGYARQRARASLFFVTVEPLVRLVAAWVSWLPLGQQRLAIDRMLRESGDVFGLDADELVASSLLTGCAGALLVYWISPTLWIALVLGSLCALIPVARIQTRRSERALSISRELPRAIDILALCVSAGMDLPGSIRELIGPDPAKDDPLHSEFRRVLRDLDLGHSRRKALKAFEVRAPADGVKEFVAAIVQSEEKGNPLGEVLVAQSSVLRMRRSFRAEVMASQAGVKMVIPLAMMMLGLLVLIAAPLFLQMRENGL